MKRFILTLVYKICSFKKIREKSILIIESSFPSGSNTRPLIKELQEDYDITIMEIKDIHFEKHSWNDYVRYIKTLYHISTYQLMITTHGFKKPNPNQTLIDLWHGIPLKAMMYMEQYEDTYDPEGFNSDFLITSSKLESTLLAACTQIPYARHKILGSPRTDYLLKSTTNPYQAKLKSYNKVLIYVPTYRQGYQNRVEGETSLDFIYHEEFLNYLSKNNYLLIVKLHPLEESLHQTTQHEYILFLTNEELKICDLDLYELLPFTDLLITDYSSIYFDYLLLDKPIVFIDRDLEWYREARGLLLEPYDHWTPGQKCEDHQDLMIAITESLKFDEFREKREDIKEIFHPHQDGKSTERVIQLITQLVK